MHAFGCAPCSKQKQTLDCMCAQLLTAVEVDALAVKLGTWLGGLRKVELEMAMVRPTDVVVPIEISLSRVVFQGTRHQCDPACSVPAHGVPGMCVFKRQCLNTSC